MAPSTVGRMTIRAAVARAKDSLRFLAGRMADLGLAATSGAGALKRSGRMTIELSAAGALPEAGIRAVAVAAPRRRRPSATNRPLRKDDFFIQPVPA